LYDWGVPTRLHPSQAIALIDDTVTFLATEQLKFLLETKHLYQRVSIDPTERIAAVCADFVYTDQPSRVPKYLAELATATLALGSGQAAKPLLPHGCETSQGVRSAPATLPRHPALVPAF
jgi:hypothetical protein